MNFEIISTEIFLKQIERLSKKYKKQIKNKIRLIKQNPYRFKRIHSGSFSHVFRVRMNIESKKTRLIYVISGSKIF